jgi:hypothetical protein
MCKTKRKKRRNKEEREGKTNYFWANNNAYICRHAFVHTLRVLDCIVAEGGGNNLLRNVGNCLSVDTLQCARGLDCSQLQSELQTQQDNYQFTIGSTV